MSNRIYIIGMGPGREEMMTGEAIAALEQADVIVGYTVYVKLLGERFAGKKLLTTSMRQETERCKLCFREAEAGNQVALICSGDAGIYGLASLMYELGAKHPETELLVIPGITAASSGAAVLGAPLNHDFCVISLSDLMTPWEKIEKRLRAAAVGDFAMAIYNPSSHRRKDYLQRACDILLETIEGKRPCGYVENIGREDPKLKQLFDLNCKLVITSRIQFDSLKSINIGALDEKWAKELFYTFYLGEKNEDCFHEIYNLAQGHPLSIELIAKTAQSSRFNLEEMVQQLRSTGFELPEMKENVIYEEYNKILIEHLNRIFSLSKLSNTYKQILYRLSLLPIEPISVDELIQWKVGKTQEEFEILFHRGWIYLECDGVVMHPAISDAIHSKSSKRYTIYQNMYVAMRNELELSGSTRAHEKYMRMLTFYHVVKRREFKRQEYAELLNQIAVILKNMGEREEAIRLQEKTIKIKKQCGCGKSTLFTGYNNLALAYGRADLRKNLIYCEKAEKIGRELFKEDPEEYALKFATTLNNLSLSYLNNGDLEKAEATQNESISIKTEYRGEDCIELAQSYNNMAIVKKRQNEYDEAYRYQKKSIAIKDAPDYATHLYNMAGMENARGNNEQAVYYIEMAIELWEVDSEFYYYKLMEAYERDLQLLNRDTLTNSVKIQQVVRKIQQLQREKSK